VIGEKDILLALEEPPQNTRASMRGRIIREAYEKNVEVIVENWESIRIIDKRKEGVNHPFVRQKRAVNGVKAKLKDPFESFNGALLSRVRSFMDGCDQV
jgi:hypothetical protein